MNKKTLVVAAATITIIIAAAIALYFGILKKTTIRVETPSAAGQPTIVTGKRLLAIYSYHPEWGWNIDTEKGIIDELSTRGLIKGTDYDLRSFYMDTKVTYPLPGQIQARADIAKKLIDDYNPDLVFINDDIALNYVAVPYTIQHPESKLPFVFAGVNGDPSLFESVIDSLTKPGHNITGTLERFPFTEGFSLVKKVFPSARNIVLFADASESSTAVINTMKADGLLTNKTLALTVTEIVQVEKFSDWQKKITEYQTKASAIGTLTYAQLKDEDGNIVPAEDVVSWTIEHNKLPELGFLLFHSEDGFLMAAGVSPYKTGLHIASMAADILSGARTAGDIPITDPKLIDIAFNIKRAEMLGVRIPIDTLGIATKVYTEIKSIRF